MQHRLNLPATHIKGAAQSWLAQVETTKLHHFGVEPVLQSPRLPAKLVHFAQGQRHGPGGRRWVFLSEKARGVVHL